MEVVIAEDQYLIRRALGDLLSAHGIGVAASVPDATDIVELVQASGADLALLDIRMPPSHTDEGIRAAVALRTARPGFPVMLLSQYVEQLYLDELLTEDSQAVGYLLKDRVLDDTHFVASLRSVAAGGTAIDPEVVAQLLHRRRNRSRLERLTVREHEVLTHMAEGSSNTEIATMLVITEKAVSKHINSIFSKLDLPDSQSNARRVLAVLAFLRG